MGFTWTTITSQGCAAYLAQPTFSVQLNGTYLSHEHGHSESPSCWAGPSPCSYTRQRPPAARWLASECRCSQRLADGGWMGAMRSFCTTLWSSKGSQSHGSEQKHPVRQSLWCFSLDECWHGLKSDREWERNLYKDISWIVVLTSNHKHDLYSEDFLCLLFL